MQDMVKWVQLENFCKWSWIFINNIYFHRYTWIYKLSTCLPFLRPRQVRNLWKDLKTLSKLISKDDSVFWKGKLVWAFGRFFEGQRLVGFFWRKLNRKHKSYFYDNMYMVSILKILIEYIQWNFGFTEGSGRRGWGQLK